MKKIKCILLPVILLLNLFSIGIEAEEYGASENYRLDTLIGLKILKGYSIDEVNEKAYVPGGQFVNAVLNLFSEEEQFNKELSDSAVKMAKDKKLLKNIDSFSKNKSITYGQALEILTGAIGYDQIFDKKSAEEKAAISGLLANVSGDENASLTYGQMISLLYNALDVNVIKYNTNSGGSTEYSIDSGKTILEEYKKIEKIKGIVNENSYTSLAGDALSKGKHIAINGAPYDTKEMDWDNYLGMYVEAYVKYDDKEDANILCFVRALKNDLLEINREDITNVDDSFSFMEYLPESYSKTKRLKLSPVVKIIYNGNAYANYDKNDFLSDNGGIIAIDNDSDGLYDVVKITSYKTMVVEGCSVYDGVIYNKYQNDNENLSYKVDLSDSYTEYIIKKDVKAIKLKDISKGDVVLISEPKSGSCKKVNIIVSQNTVEGMIQSIDSSENEIKLNGVSYKISDVFSPLSNGCMELKTGNYFKLYLDSFGKVVYARVSSINADSYGFMTKIFSDEENDELYKIKLYTYDDEWVYYKLKDKIKYNGDSGVRAANVWDDLTDESGFMPQGQMIRYRINQSGQVYVIDTATVSESYDEDSFTKKIVKDDDFRRETYQFIYNEVSLSEDAKIMIIPVNQDDTGNYSIQPRTYIQNGSKACVAYDIDEWNISSYLSIDFDEATQQNSVAGANFFVVESVNKALNADDEVCDKVTGYSAHYGMISLYGNEENRFGDVKPGDILQIATNPKSEVSVSKRAFSADDIGMLIWKEPWNFQNATTVLAGYVRDVEAEKRMLKINCGDEHCLRFNEPNAYQPFDVVIVDMKHGKVDKGSVYDIRPGDYLVADMSWYLISNVVIYR